MFEINELVQRKHKVLIADDLENNRKILQNFLLKNEFEVELACDGDQCLELAKNFKPDLIILDVMMPVMDGYETCKKLRLNTELADIPVIFITAKNQQRDVVAGFEAGGNDYIAKPFFIEEVLFRIKVHIENKLFKEILFELSMVDPLTGLWNRRCFYERAGAEIKRAKRYSNEFSFVIFDIDNFKKINDKFGHDVGDEVLVSLAEKIKCNIRATDMICRWGGEEFVIIFLEAPKDKSVILCEKLRELISGSKFVTKGGDLAISASFGVSSLSELELDNYSIEALCSLADKRLYMAKNTGKNRVVFK